VSRCVLLAAGLLVAAPPAVRASEVWREQSQKTVDVAGIRSLQIVNSRGRVDLLPSPDGKLHLTALKIVRVREHERAQEVARGIVVETGARGDRYHVEVHYQKRHYIRVGFWDLFKSGGLTFPRHEVRIAAQVPRGLSLDVRETSGDVFSDGMDGPQVLRSTSGDVEVRTAGGRVDASTTSGDVTANGLKRGRLSTVSGDLMARQVAGPLRASSTSGSITVVGAEDSLDLSSVSGDIRADRAPRGLQAETSSGTIVAGPTSGTVSVGTSSGDVRLALHEPLISVEGTTSSGDIQVRLTPAIRCRLDLETSSGSLDVSVPMGMQTVTRRSVKGTVRGGQTPVVFHTSSGDITVTEGGD
jgi:DUF4097 and DUF4098 domain-containing protein YvlB